MSLEDIKHKCINDSRRESCPMKYDPIICCNDCGYAFKCTELCLDCDVKDCEYDVEDI